MARNSKRARRLGPFTEGLVQLLEPSAISDAALSEIINFEQELDGSLKNRPAIVSDSALPDAGADNTLLGPDYYTDTSGNTFAVVTVGTTTRLYNIVTKVWTQIWAHKASGWVQYDNKVVLISETVVGGYWEAGVFTATPTMPLGSDIVFFKERFWAFGVRGTANATTVWFSNLTAAGPPATTIYTWSALDYFTVSQGDGEWVTGIIAGVNSLYIFRNASAWKFSYNSTPLASGTLSNLSTTVGADNKWSFSRYENYYVVLSNGTLYEMINEYFYPLNELKVNFQRSAYVASRSIETCLSIFGDRAIVWYYGAIYVFNMKLRGWTRWLTTTTNAARFLQIPQTALQRGEPAALAVTGGTVTAQKVLYRIKEGTVSGNGEEMSCMIRTKAYDFGISALKRLFYYDAEVRTSRGVDSFVFPITLPAEDPGVTWNQMTLAYWPTNSPDIGDLLQLQTWNSPLSAGSITSFEDSVDFPTTNPLQLLIKFIRGGFARRFYFEFYISTNGNGSTSPVRIYTITVYVGEKAYAAAKVS
jgi:hypothetical protein